MTVTTTQMEKDSVDIEVFPKASVKSLSVEYAACQIAVEVCGQGWVLAFLHLSCFLGCVLSPQKPAAKGPLPWALP